MNQYRFCKFTINRPCFGLFHHSFDRHKPLAVISGIQQIIADASFPGRVDEFDVARRHFGDNAYVPDALAFGAVAFEENKVAGLGIVEFYHFTVLGLRCAGMRERNIPLVETIPDKAGAVETPFGGTARTVGNMQMLGSEQYQGVDRVQGVGGDFLGLRGLCERTVAK